MNRLILIGNGFDLAHGLKTSYNDFILWYLKKVLSEAEQKTFHEDDLLKVNKIPNVSLPMHFKSISEFVDHFYAKKLYQIVNQTFKVEGWQNDYQNPFEITIKSHLLSLLFDKCSYTQWVEIENDFYEILKSILREKSNERENNLKNLNVSLGAIIKCLEEYLSGIKPTHLHSEYTEIFTMPILRRDIVADLTFEDQQPKETLILNFNYTSTIEEYFKPSPYSLKPKNFAVNYIHGKIEDTKNPLIFGFGDELDSDYNTMELEKLKGFFNYIKSFWYFKTSNYHNLIRFIEADEYQITILGHSCGLSDRTMLNMLFEHENCKSIKIYYYESDKGYNNYDDLTLEISRHFKNKLKMRRVIVSQNNSIAMPQVEIP